MWIGFIQPTEYLNRTKMLSKRDIILPVRAGHWFSLALGLELTPIGSPGSQAFGPRMELYYWFSWVSGLPIADLGTSQPPYLHEPIPYNKFLLISIYPIGL